MLICDLQSSCMDSGTRDGWCGHGDEAAGGRRDVASLPVSGASTRSAVFGFFFFFQVGRVCVSGPDVSVSFSQRRTCLLSKRGFLCQHMSFGSSHNRSDEGKLESSKTSPSTQGKTVRLINQPSKQVGKKQTQFNRKEAELQRDKRLV